jgi:hypothetical protein
MTPAYAKYAKVEGRKHATVTILGGLNQRRWVMTPARTSRMWAGAQPAFFELLHDSVQLVADSDLLHQSLEFHNDHGKLTIHPGLEALEAVVDGDESIVQLAKKLVEIVSS